LTHVQVVFGSHGPKERSVYTLTLYQNDGPKEPNPGLLQPGTKLASFQTVALNQPLPGQAIGPFTVVTPPDRRPLGLRRALGHQRRRKGKQL